MKRTLAWALLAVCTVLLVSYGGAIIAAPITVPLLFAASRSSSSTGYRIGAGIVVALTIAELAWALTYVVLGEEAPAIWLVPTVATLAAVAGYARLSRRPLV